MEKNSHKLNKQDIKEKHQCLGNHLSPFSSCINYLFISGDWRIRLSILKNGEILFAVSWWCFPLFAKHEMYDEVQSMRLPS